MKKSIIFATLAVLGLSAAVFTHSVKTSNAEISLLSQNVEALARSEGGEDSEWKYEGTFTYTNPDGTTSSVYYVECGGWGSVVC